MSASLNARPKFQTLVGTEHSEGLTGLVFPRFSLGFRAPDRDNILYVGNARKPGAPPKKSARPMKAGRKAPGARLNWRFFGGRETDNRGRRR
jgi:hypothetical protein